MRSSWAKRIILSGVHILRKVINWMGYISLTGMVVITATNVFGRYILKKPLLGEVDMVELGMAVFGGIAMFIAATQRHHVGVDVLVVRFPPRIQLILGRIASLLGFITLAVLAVGVFLNGLGTLENGSTTDTLRVPQGPFETLFSVFIFLFCLTLLIQAFRPEESEKKEEGGPRNES
jgi:TRAP-type C4-dicarboxylate transport system permease small subunit